jgi:hypothetical protein
MFNAFCLSPFVASAKARFLPEERTTFEELFVLVKALIEYLIPSS